MENIIGPALAAGALLLLILAGSALFNARSEGARRIKLVLGALLALGFLAFVFAAAGIGGLALAIALIAVTTWVVRGFRG